MARSNEKEERKKEEIQMRKKRLLLAIAAVAAVVVLNIAVAAAADEQVVKVGKKGEIMFDQDTQVGGLTLKAGHYQIQHRVEGSDHMIHFTEFKGMHNPSHPSGPSSTAHSGEMKCRLEPLNAKASRTAVFVNTEGGVRRVTKIEIQGENVAHVF
jgi:opacity protein-like surface antigen